MICLKPKPGESFFIHRIQIKEKKLQKKSFLWGVENKKQNKKDF